MATIDLSRVERLMRPQHVAIIGASGDPTKLTGRPIGYLKKFGFSGQIFPVNPRLSQISDLTCYPDIQSLPTARATAESLPLTAMIRTCVQMKPIAVMPNTRP